MSVKGYRIWHLTEERDKHLRLRSIGGTDYQWEPGDNNASCRCSARRTPHIAGPGLEGHSCGFWAYATFVRAWDRLREHQGNRIRQFIPVLGVIDGWGRVTIGIDDRRGMVDDGFRCEHARILAFIYDPVDLPPRFAFSIYSEVELDAVKGTMIRTIAAKFDVPVIQSKDAHHFAENRTVSMYEAMQRWPESFGKPRFTRTE